jgi:ER-bound oxygenase mpaB/B'/Rubber oxygenase, catalytic domain
MFPTRFSHLPEARARFGDRVDRLGAFLDRGDPLADDVVAAIEGTPGGWILFDEAAKGGIDGVAGAPASFRALFDQAEHVPLWVDWETVDRGGEVLLRAGPLGGIVLALKSLVLGYTSPAGNKPLVFSGRLQENAPRRLNETARFVQATITPRAMRPRGEGWQITLKVRLIHAQVRRMILKTGRWDTAAWGSPINQHDQAATLLLFSTIVLEGLRQLGVHIPAAEAEAYIQLWRWSGWVMGVDAELLAATEAEGVRLRELIAATMGEPDQDSRDLTRALLDAPLRRGETPRERANADRAVRFNAALCRSLLGEAMADKLAVPSTPWRYSIPFVRRLVASVDLVRRRLPFADVRALSAGTRYWDRVVEIGLAGTLAEFGLPQGLAARAA